MHRSVLVSALGALVACSVAQNSADFVDMAWGNVTVGQLWPIYWSPGDGQSVSLTFGNDTFSSSIFSPQPAMPGVYDWTVTVSPEVIAGYYSLSLSQQGAGTSISPTFYLSFGDIAPPLNNATVSPTTASPTSSTTTIPVSISTVTPVLPTVTVMWYEEDCGCTRTSVCDTIPLPTATGGAPAPTTWYEEQCGCSKTAYPATPTAPANNYTIPQPTPMSQPPAINLPATQAVAPPKAEYTGAAVKLSSAGLGVVALMAAALGL